MKQTAVEWLVSELPHLEVELLRPIIEQAKQMEKEQMEDMFETGHICGMDDCHKMNNGEIFTSVIFEQYYNETYGKNGIQTTKEIG